MALANGHIGLGAHLLSLREDYRAAGVSHYIYHLLKHLPPADPSLSYTAYLGFSGAALPAALRQVASAWPTQRPVLRILWEQLAAPLAAWRERIDLWHALVNVQPLLLPRPAVTTIQDLSFMIYPDHFRAGNRLYNRLFVRLTARRSRHIITTSHSTKQDVVRLFRLPPAKITVTHLAAGEGFQPIADRQAVAEFRRRKGLPERFILYIGTLEPRKNLPRLIEAYALLRKRAHISHHLVIGGGKGWLFEHIFAAAQELGVQDTVHFPGFIPQAELVWWYNSADIFCYPSLFEGFGLPPLEAMACGTPVVTAKVSSLPEIVGDAALAVDPHSTAQMAEAIEMLLSDQALHAQLRQAGLKRASIFSWTRTALETTRVYHKLLSEERSRHV